MTPPQHTVASLLIETLAEAGVNRLYTLSGNQILPIFDAAIDAGIELIHVRHEAAAVHMADAWARLTDRPGVALVAGGPAHGNTVSALLTALEAESPVVLVSGQSPLHDAGRGGFQEAPHAEMAGPVTKRSWTITEPGAIEDDIERALHIATSGRPGPVHIGVPVDGLEMAAPAEGRSRSPDVSQSSAPVPVDVVLEFLGLANRPLVIVGPAMKRRSADLDRLMSTIGVPVVAMESPRGVEDPSLGRFAGVLAKADAVLLLGKRLDWSLRFADTETFRSDCRFVQIDADQAELDRTAQLLSGSDRLVQSILYDPGLAGLALIEHHGDGAGSRSWRDEVRAATTHRPRHWELLSAAEGDPLHAAEVCRAIQPWLNGRSVHVCDGGEFGQWAQALLVAQHRIINGPAGGIGASIPFAIAAKQAMPRSRVIATLGDGALGFHAMEFDTAVRYQVPFVAIVGNDARWNTEYQLQLQRPGVRDATAYNLLPSRYDKVAEALGGHGEYVTSANELEPALERAFASDKPSCVNVRIASAPAPAINDDPDEEPGQMRPDTSPPAPSAV